VPELPTRVGAGVGCGPGGPADAFVRPCSLPRPLNFGRPEGVSDPRA